jgi:hypothetical protein
MFVSDCFQATNFTYFSVLVSPQRVTPCFDSGSFSQLHLGYALVSTL